MVIFRKNWKTENWLSNRFINVYSLEISQIKRNSVSTFLEVIPEKRYSFKVLNYSLSGDNEGNCSFYVDVLGIKNCIYNFSLDIQKSNMQFNFLDIVFKLRLQRTYRQTVTVNTNDVISCINTVCLDKYVQIKHLN